MKSTKKKKIIKKIKVGKKRLFKLDKILFFIVLFWLFFGLLVFSSASLGLMAKNGNILSSILSKQIITLIIAFIAMLLVAQIKFKNIINLSPYIFAFSVALSLLVFVPGIAFSSGGASRWIQIGPFTLQPAEFLKFSTVLFAIYIFIKYKKMMPEFKSLIFPAAILSLPLAILLAQPDTSTSFLILFAVALLYFLFGAPWKNILLAAFAALLGFALLVSFQPYIKKRIMTYIDGRKDTLGSAYQINQSLIAIGSGGVLGKGFGQGVQKFGYLPEPVGDSVFATLAEEFGFVGVFVILLLLILFLLRSFKLASKSRSISASAGILAFSSMIVIQALVNIGAMSAVLPLTGLTFPLMSLGGSSLLSTLLAIGVIFSASKA